MSDHVIITPAMYFMGRDRIYANQLTDALRANAEVIIARVNLLLARAADDGVALEPVPPSRALGEPDTFLTSGWRPLSVNERTPGAALKSLHITCEAADVHDPDGELDEWCMAHLTTLAEIGLWLEHPLATKGWTHLQTRGPKSGRRVFYP